MKKIFFLFAMLTSLAASAQRTTPVTIVNTKVDYSTKTVTFDLSWKGSDANHRNEVWVFVDIQPVTDVNMLGSWSPATLVPSATTITAGSGNQYSSLTHTVVSGNTRGVWVKGTSSATTSTFNATVKITLAPVTPAQFNACAYVTDYPPNIASVSSGTYTLKGTQSFILNGTTISGNKYTGSVNSLTDPTGCPGCIAIRDFNFNSSSVSIPCCPNLAAVGGYCRDLVADNASTFTGCGLEVSNEYLSGVHITMTCPSGWRFPTHTEIQCMFNNRSALNLNVTSSDEVSVKFTNPTTTCNIDAGCATPYEGGTYVYFFGGLYCNGGHAVPMGGCTIAHPKNGGVGICVR
ncbi:MAG: hypothetical protein LBD87_03565 [Prevotellaceae bacterium]|jgi:archaellum component FlaF (FlaF/FlaG flagellin family)|nr:hypothetical protein [Prevotellaceae bacterium]